MVCLHENKGKRSYATVANALKAMERFVESYDHVEYSTPTDSMSWMDGLLFHRDANGWVAHNRYEREVNREKPITERSWMVRWMIVATKSDRFQLVVVMDNEWAPDRLFLQNGITVVSPPKGNW
jgi:hypothetical protein